VERGESVARRTSRGFARAKTRGNLTFRRLVAARAQIDRRSLSCKRACSALLARRIVILPPCTVTSRGSHCYAFADCIKITWRFSKSTRRSSGFASVADRHSRSSSVRTDLNGLAELVGAVYEPLVSVGSRD